MAKLFIPIIFFFLTAIQFSSAQSTGSALKSDLYKTIFQQDSMLFSSFNSCNLEVNKNFFTDDLEFYHDKDGLEVSLKRFIEKMENGLCNEQQRKLGKNRIKRELIKESLEVYPIKNYGALQIGSHYFYDDAEGKKEKPSGLADFAHLWQYKDNKWQISKVLSLDHRDPESKTPSPYKELFNELATQDSLLFATVNHCDPIKNQAFFKKDLEFYHDKGGLHGYEEEIQSMKELCERVNQPKMRRELVKGSLEVCPIKGYGAVQMGEHNFFFKEKGKKERLGSTAKFIHIWQNVDNNWKLSRVISYDHQNGK